MLAENLSNFGYLLPWAIWVSITIGIILLTVVIIIFRRNTRESASGDDSEYAKKPHFLRDFVSKIMTSFGFYPKDPMAMSFSHAVRLLKSFIGGKNCKYKLPWYLLLGEEGTGKTSLMYSQNLNLPVGRPHFHEFSGEEDECEWWFFDRGIMLDIKGKLFLKNNAIQSSDDRWDVLLNLLGHHRNRRPVDGIVLTISAADLLDTSDENKGNMALKAEYIYTKLWELQRKTGLRLPVYVTITKSDLIPGFSDFTSKIPVIKHSDIFGWSNSKSLDAIYESYWVGDALDSIIMQLRSATEAIYTNTERTADNSSVFLLPKHIANMKENLSLYLNHIFKASGYHESFFLRGVYFTGNTSVDSNVEENYNRVAKKLYQAEERLFGSDSYTSDLFSENKICSNIVFVDDLLNQKIFREVGLARPVSNLLLGQTRAMQMAKIVVGVLAIIVTIGLLKANDDLRKARFNLLPALTEINHVLAVSADEEESSEAGRYFFEKQSEALLNMIVRVDTNDLFSPFVFPSWMSSLDNKIRDVMAIAFDEVILKSMSKELNYIATDLVSLGSRVPLSPIETPGITPTNTDEFQELRQYVYSIQALSLAASKFNDIGTVANLQDVADIILYLFKIKMPKEFFINDNYYARALERTKIRLFNFDQYRDEANKKLHMLFDRFQEAAFDPEVMIPGLGDLARGLTGFSTKRNLGTVDDSNLRIISESLSLIFGALNDPRILWIDSDNFDPGLEYQHVISTMAASPLLGANITSELLEETSLNFFKFKQKLASYSSPLMQGLLFDDDGVKILAKPSEGAQRLASLLNLFYSESFMRKASDNSFASEVPTGSILLWDSIRLEQANTMLNSYNSFINERLLTYPSDLQNLLRRVGSESMVKNLKAYLYEAQVFTTTPVSVDNSSPEDALLQQVQNYRATNDKLLRVLVTLKNNDSDDSYSKLRYILTQQNYLLLKKLDDILVGDNAYAIKDGDFSWWDGDNLAALEAFGVSSIPELNGYLDLQRKRIEYLAYEFATPVVDFLTKVNSSGMPGDLPVLSKWSDILNELKDYSKKAPNNGLSQLENFIEFPLNQVTIATCKKYASGLTPMQLGNAYFVGILENIQDKLLKRCQQLSGDMAIAEFTLLSDYFNANLAGKFPFAAIACDGQMRDPKAIPDANAEDIAGFYELFDEKTKDIEEKLANSSLELGAAGKRALSFVKDMKDVREFFGGFLAKGSTQSMPQFSYKVSFRVNKQAERAANQIVDWNIQNGDTIYDFREKSEPIVWKPFDPIMINLRWARNSLDQPYYNGINQYMTVDGSNVSFKYYGNWGLLRALLSQRPSLGDFRNLKEDQPQTMRFDIPITNDVSQSGKQLEEAKVFIRFEVKPLTETRNKDTGETQMKPGKIVRLPNFPTMAPVLNGGAS